MHSYGFALLQYVQQMCIGILILHAFMSCCLHAWADVMQRLSVSQQYPPSVSFAACSKEAGPLCVCQPSSLGPIVKLNKLVCSGNPLMYGGEQVQGQGGGQRSDGELRV